MVDQRQFSRIPFRKALGLEAGETDDFQGVVARDLSGGGLRLRLDQFLPLGHPVRVQLQLEDEEEVFVLTGKVVWVQKEPQGEYYQIGVMFEDEPSNSLKRNRLLKFIDTDEA